MRILIFSRSGLKVLFTAPKFQFLGLLPPKFRGTLFRPPKGTSLSGTTRFEPSLVQIGRTVRPVAFPKTQTGYLPRLPTSPYRSQSLHAGWPPVCSSIFQVLLKSIQWFCRCGWSENRPSPLLWPLAYTTACTTVQAVILMSSANNFVLTSLLLNKSTISFT